MSWRRTDDQIMSGATLHDGLEYQALVTALAAIELVIVAGYADALQIEPASDDDIEGDINRPLADDEPTPGFSESDASTSAESYRLVIQVKRRDHDPALASDLIGQISAEGRAAIDAKILDALRSHQQYRDGGRRRRV